LFNTYAGGDQLNVSELTGGLNAEIDDYHHGWIYGYFFAPGGWTTAADALRDAVIWLDYNISGSNVHRLVDVPKLGHPYHVPIAVPTGGNYNHWIVIRGIHTNRSMWDTSIPGDHDLINGSVTMYGFWLNDPSLGGLRSNMYVTTQRFISNYFFPINVLGDPYINKYLVITDPPQDIHVDTSTLNVVSAPNTMVFSVPEAKQIQRTMQSTTGITSFLMNNKLVSTAYDQAYQNVLRYDTVFGPEFAEAKAVGKILATMNGDYTVTFRGTMHVFKVVISWHGGLQEIQIQNLS